MATRQAHAAGERDRPQRPDAAAQPVGPRPGRHPRRRAADLDAGERQRGGRHRPAALLVEVEGEEAEDGDLRQDHPRRPQRQAPDAPVAQRAGRGDCGGGSSSSPGSGSARRSPQRRPPPPQARPRQRQQGRPRPRRRRPPGAAAPRRSPRRAGWTCGAGRARIRAARDRTTTPPRGRSPRWRSSRRPPRAPARRRAPRRTSSARRARAPPAAPVRPTAITSRSPTRSASAPQASSVATMPTVEAARRAPVSAIESPYSLRICGATAGRPSWTAEMLAWAAIPTARTTHR